MVFKGITVSMVYVPKNVKRPRIAWLIKNFRGITVLKAFVRCVKVGRLQLGMGYMVVGGNALQDIGACLPCAVRLVQSLVARIATVIKVDAIGVRMVTRRNHSLLRVDRDRDNFKGGCAMPRSKLLHMQTVGIDLCSTVVFFFCGGALCG